MRALGWAVVAVALTGCSIFFDPTKAPVACVATNCAVLPQATARCENGKCAYSCLAGRTDPNGDLGNASGNGCEGCGPAAVAPALHALVGNPAGGVHWMWNRPDAGGLAPVSFTLCTGTQPSALGNCQTLEAKAVCATPSYGFECNVLTTGHVDDQRLYGRVQSVNVCGDTEPVGATQSTSPFDGTLLSVKPLPADAGGDNACDAGVTTVGGARRIEQTSPNACVTALTFGDNAWQDFTLTGQIQLADPATAGFAFHYPNTGGMAKTRNSLLLSPSSTAESEFTAAMTTLPNTATIDRLAATAVPTVPAGQWVDVEIVSVKGEVAVTLGTPTQAPAQVLRWVEPPGISTGRFAAYVLTISSPSLQWAMFQNVQVSTNAVLPPRGPSTKMWDWTAATLPAGTRVAPTLQTGQGVKMVNCSAYAEATGCDGGCRPATGSQCVQINQPSLFRRSLTFDQPVGLDPAQPWRLSFKFAPMAANDAAASLLRTAVGNPIFRGPTSPWPGPLFAFGTVTDGTIEPQKWNRIDLRVNGDSFRVALNGKSLDAGTTLFPPQGWDRHLGAFTFGGPDLSNLNLDNVQGQWTDLEIAQPP